MVRYIIGRALQGLLVVWAVSLIAFALGRISGSPVDSMLQEMVTGHDREDLERRLGLDRPLYLQYLSFVGDGIRGDFGLSYRTRESVGSTVLDRLPATLQLAAAALFVSVALGIPLGVVAAAKRGTGLDTLAKGFALLGQSMPGFWVGIVLIYVFSVTLGLLPSSGKGGIQNLVLPSVALGWYSAAGIMRLVRSGLLEALDSDYVRVARAKGLPEWRVLWLHALKNAMIPTLTFVGVSIGALMTGSVIIETVFRWPGLGSLAIEGVVAREYGLVQALLMLFALLYVGVYLVIDIAYAYVDPRIRYS